MFARVKVFSICLLLLGSVTAMAGWESEKIERDLEINPGETLSVSNTNGSIEVDGWDQGHIALVAIKKAKGGRGHSAQEKLDHMEVSIEKSGNGWQIETKVDRSWMRSRKMNNTSVNYKLRVPQELVLELETTNGEIELHEFSGSVKLETTNGNLVGRGIRGHIDAATTNGSVTMALLEHDGEDLICKTTNGNVNLALPADVRADVSARTTNGSIKSDIPLTISGSFSRNRLKGSLNGGGSLIELRTTNGSIRISEEN